MIYLVLTTSDVLKRLASIFKYTWIDNDSMLATRL